MTQDMPLKQSMPEPWLRGTRGEIPAVLRAVLHALELGVEDIQKWCAPLTKEQWNARPLGLPPVAFHVKHIARSLDRLLTYAEGRQLTSEQLTALKTELDSDAEPAPEALMREFEAAIGRSTERILGFLGANLEQPRFVGKKQLPTTLGGLLVHVADHTQRHVGQAVTTAKIVLAQRP